MKLKISDGFKFEIGQFLARLTISAVVFGGIAAIFFIAVLIDYITGN